MLTVLLATRNRAQLLRDVLESYCGLEEPPDGWRLLIADNGSTDDTPLVLESFRPRLPLSCIREPRPGKNAALNSALPLVDGDLLVFTDDDAFPTRDWLCQIRKVADSQPAYSIFGGLVVPRWELQPPDWLLNLVPLGPTFTLSNPETPEGPSGVENIFGPNMAVRVSALADGLAFDEAIGPRDGDYAMGSETEFVMRLMKTGHKAWFTPHAVVEHMIRESQMNKGWVLQRAARYGRGQYRLAGRDGQLRPRVPTWWGIPRYLYLQLALEMVAVAKAALTADADAGFRARWRLSYLQGEMDEARHTVPQSKFEATRQT